MTYKAWKNSIAGKCGVHCRCVYPSKTCMYCGVLMQLVRRVHLTEILVSKILGTTTNDFIRSLWREQAHQSFLAPLADIAIALYHFSLSFCRDWTL